jgi:hypothetical protein
LTHPRARIGILGGGVSGMAAAWMLQDDHDVTLLERESRLGGHVETVPVEAAGRTVHAELGTRFFFDPSYPYFLALLRVLGVPTRWTDATVSITDVASARTVFLPPSLPPRSASHVTSLVRSPRLVRHLLSLRRLVSEQPEVFRQRDWSLTIERYLADHDYPQAFGPEFIYPFLAACWGSPLPELNRTPVYSLLKGMPLGTSPGFFEIERGMSRYVQTFAEQLTQVRVGLDAEVRRIEGSGPFLVEDARGERWTFDHLLVATGSRDALALLRGLPAASPLCAQLEGFRHFETHIVVHGDVAQMPRRRRDWAHTNLFFDGPLAWMSDWQGLAQDAPVFRLWLPRGRPPPSNVYAERRYHHLVMTPENALLQRRIAALQGAHNLWLTGMYTTDVDNHESALLSALVPVRALAPRSRNLARLLGAVAPGAAHGLEILPTAQ